MIRRSTWFLLAIFVVLLGATIYLQKNPLPEKVEVTPSPTALPKLLGAWQSSEIRWIEVRKGEAEVLVVAQDDAGNWVIGPDTTETADAGMIEVIRSGIAGALVQATLSSDYDLSALGLDAPIATITLKNQTGEEVVIQVGAETPTGTGYYVSVGQKAPMVVNQGVIDDILEQMTMESLVPEPIPMETQPTALP